MTAVDFSSYSTGGPDTFGFGVPPTPGSGPVDWGVFTAEAQGTPPFTPPESRPVGSIWDTTGIAYNTNTSIDSDQTAPLTSILSDLGNSPNPIVTAASSVPGGTDLLEALTKPGGLSTWWKTFTSQLGAQSAAASKAASSVQTQQVLSNKTGASAQTLLIIGAIGVAGIALFSLSGRR